MSAPTFDLVEGDGPLVVSAPHCGTLLAPGLAERLSAAALTLRDTDWHIPRLYDFAGAMGASVISARYSRYVADLNRSPAGGVLYPGRAGTGLCPDVAFDGAPLYKQGRGPDPQEVAKRIETYWRPYHGALKAALDRVRARHGKALLYDAHSIASHVPRLFAGRLPDLNLGTAGGASCPAAVREALAGECAAAKGFDSVVDGRFIGGFITRAYGRPEEGVYAVQMELAQAAYMDDSAPPFAYLPERAETLRPVLKRILTRYVETSFA